MPGLLFCIFYLFLSFFQSNFFFFFLKGIFPARIFHRTWIYCFYILKKIINMNITIIKNDNIG